MFKRSRIFQITMNCVMFLSILFGSALTVTPAYAAGITVNTTADENNSGANCSLREAITAANTDTAYGGCTAGSGADVITLPAGTYTLTIAGGDEDSNATGDLDVTSNLTINGAGAANTVIQAGTIGYPNPSPNGIDRVIEILGIQSISISNITIANGNCLIPDTLCHGGGIHVQNTSTVLITNSNFSGNSADSGGGLWNSGGNITIINNIFSSNNASLLNNGHGGGIINASGMLNVTNSTFSGNVAAGVGGAIHLNGSLTASGSTFLGNTSASQGGAISIYSGGTQNITNSTFSGNTAVDEGGGIYNYDGLLSVTNSTFSGNGADTAGAIYNYIYGFLHLRNTILANSIGSADCYNISGDTISTNSNNFIEANGPNGSMCGTPSITGTDPALGPLANNGGFTQTMALLAGSSAIDAGSDAVCAAVPVSNTSQNGVTRPEGSHCDIGSYERDLTSPTASSVVRVNPDPTALPSVQFTVTFSEPVIGVDAGDMGLTTTGTINSVSIINISGSGATRTVTVNTGVGQGTIRLNIYNNLSIQDPTGNSLSGGDFTSGETYTITRSPFFADVPYSYWANSFIERLYHANITGGCSVSPLNYCPESTVTRDQMAIFLERGIQGSTFVPPNVVPTFGDTPGNFAEDWIEALKNDGITGGCGGGNYCPSSGVTRAQMAIFLERSMHGSSFVPPNVSPTFSDTAGNFAEDWIEALKNDAITNGCGAGIYCPDDVVTRAQMAVFLVKAFNLP